MEILLDVPGVPPGKNRRYKVIRLGRRASMRNSDEFLAWVELLREAWKTARLVGGRFVVGPAPPRIDTGLWTMRLVARWPRQRHLAHGSVPLGDIDACVSAVLDGLQKIEVLDDDVRVDQVVLRRTFDRANPGVSVRLRRIDALPAAE